jgi:hypothetical protein
MQTPAVGIAYFIHHQGVVEDILEVSVYEKGVHRYFASQLAGIRQSKSY